jgi:hypothetical protein
MKRYTKKDLAFIQFVKDECKRLGVKNHIKDVQYVKLSPTIRCSGYFDDTDEPILAASMGKEDGLSILVHEYCHLTQWQDGFHLWKKAARAIPVIDEWLDGKYKRPDVLDRAFEISIGLELDNERRSVKMIKKWGLSIDTTDYVKRANAYLQFYNWLRKTRKWSKPGNQPYNNKRLVEAMPETFRMNYSKLPKKFETIYREENI